MALFKTLWKKACFLKQNGKTGFFVKIKSLRILKHTYVFFGSSLTPVNFPSSCLSHLNVNTEVLKY